MTVLTATILACRAMLIFQNAQSTHYLGARLRIKNVSHGTTLSSDEIKSTGTQARHQEAGSVYFSIVKTKENEEPSTTKCYSVLT